MKTRSMTSSTSSESSDSSFDDDFTRLGEPSKPHNPTHSQQLQNPQTAMNLSSTSQVQQQTQPFLPRAAEAELYQLATNFLLYVAMVLIITLVARIYFPEVVRVRTRSYSSSIPPPSSTMETPPTSPSNKSTRLQYQKKKTTKKEENQSKSTSTSILSSAPLVDDSFNNNKSDYTIQDSEANLNNHLHTDVSQQEQLEQQQEEFTQLLTIQSTKKKKKKTKKVKKPSGNMLSTSSLSSSSPSLPNQHQQLYNHTYKDQPYLQQHFTTTLPFFHPDIPNPRANVLKRLAFCAISLNVTFVVWGLVQERMLTRKYPRFTGEYFTYSYALVFTNRFWTLILSSLLLLYLKPQRSQTTVIYEYSFPSISNMLSSWCQYESLKYVSFPAATLFKSFKLAPVMLMGVVLGGKKYPNYDYFVALLIGAGITMFMSSTDDLKVSFHYNIQETTFISNDIDGGSSSSSSSSTLLQHTDGAVWTGVMLLLLFLFFDSFTSQWQSRMFQRHVDLSMVELIFATSAYSTLLSFITLVHTHELIPAIQFMYRHSEIHLHFFIFSICSTIGQILIFYTIKNFGAVVFTIIMTIRILTSIGLSVVLYDHQITTVGFFGLVTVMAAIGYRIKRQAENSNLIKWKGMDDHKAFSLVREWHEHVDM